MPLSIFEGEVCSCRFGPAASVTFSFNPVTSLDCSTQLAVLICHTHSFQLVFYSMRYLSILPRSPSSRLLNQAHPLRVSPLLESKGGKA